MKSSHLHRKIEGRARRLITSFPLVHTILLVAVIAGLFAVGRWSCESLTKATGERQALEHANEYKTY